LQPAFEVGVIGGLLEIPIEPLVSVAGQDAAEAAHGTAQLGRNESKPVFRDDRKSRR
jgi:hypothetical protein